MSLLTLIALVALTTCAVVAAWNSWQLASKADARSKKFRLAKIAAGVGGALFVLPLEFGLHGWSLKLFTAGGIMCFLCYLFFMRPFGKATYRTRRR